MRMVFEPMSMIACSIGYRFSPLPGTGMMTR